MILTLNENFQNGQFGIQLVDEPNYDNSFPIKTNADFLNSSNQPLFDETANLLDRDGPADGGVNYVVQGLGGNEQRGRESFLHGFAGGVTRSGA